jgi:hypothetical protein
MHMLIQTETLLGVETLRIVGGMLCEVEFRRVLHDQHDRLPTHPPLSRFEMRLQNLLRRDGRIVEKPIRRERVAPPLARRIDTRLRVGSERFHDQLTASIQTLVSQINPQKFLSNPFAHHLAPCLFGR